MNARPVAVATMLLAAGLAQAQTAPPPETRQTHIMVREGGVQAVGVATGGSMSATAGAAAQFFTHIEGFDVLYDSNNVVKGAPYSAESVTEMVQTLADGNRIVRKNTASIARDGKGRTRREQTIGGLAPLVPAGGEHKLITVDDPDTGLHFTLDPETKTARKLMMKRTVVSGPQGESKEILINAGGQGPGKFEFHISEDVSAGAMNAIGSTQVQTVYVNRPGDIKKENLGKQVIEGLECEGTRSTMTIPANTFGNERPIDVVTEIWMSPELKTAVLRTTKDPRYGETTYKLTMVQRSEPLPALFEIPADYKLLEGPQNMMIAPRIRKDTKE